MDLGFERVDRDMRDLREEVKDVRKELGVEIAGVRGDIDGLRTMLVRLTGGMAVGLVGVIAAIAVSGAGGV
jgi:hypothetical protein